MRRSRVEWALFIKERKLKRPKVDYGMLWAPRVASRPSRAGWHRLVGGAGRIVGWNERSYGIHDVDICGGEEERSRSIKSIPHRNAQIARREIGEVQPQLIGINWIQVEDKGRLKYKTVHTERRNLQSSWRPDEGRNEVKVSNSRYPSLGGRERRTARFAAVYSGSNSSRSVVSKMQQGSRAGLG